MSTHTHTHIYTALASHNAHSSKATQWSTPRFKMGRVSRSDSRQNLELGYHENTSYKHVFFFKWFNIRLSLTHHPLDRLLRGQELPGSQVRVRRQLRRLPLLPEPLQLSSCREWDLGDLREAELLGLPVHPHQGRVPRIPELEWPQ